MIKYFQVVVNLKKHINTHTGINYYQCIKYDNAFSMDNIMTNMIEYSKENPINAIIVTIIYLINDLIKHIIEHTGEKPVQCSNCFFIYFNYIPCLILPIKYFLLFFQLYSFYHQKYLIDIKYQYKIIIIIFVLRLLLFSPFYRRLNGHNNNHIGYLKHDVS